MLSTEGSDFDTVIETWRAGPGGLEFDDCDDDGGPAGASRLLVSGPGRVLVRAGGYTGRRGYLRITAKSLGDIDRSVMVEALPFEAQGEVEGPPVPSNGCTWSDFSSPAFRLRPDWSGILQIETHTDVDFHEVVVMRPDHGPGLEACNWNEGDATTMLSVEAGVELAVAVFAEPEVADLPTFTLRLSRLAPPSNDQRATPTEIGELPFVDRPVTLAATSEPGEPDRCGAANTVWYSYTPTDDGQIAIDTAGSDFDTVVAVYAEHPDGLLQVACNDDVGSEKTSLTTPELVAGQRYLIQVGGYLGEAGHLELAVQPAEWVSQSVTLAGRAEGGRIGDEAGACVTSRFVPSECIRAPLPGS